MQAGFGYATDATRCHARVRVRVFHVIRCFCGAHARSPASLGHLARPRFLQTTAGFCYDEMSSPGLVATPGGCMLSFL